MRRSFPGVSSVKKGVVYLAGKLKGGRANPKEKNSPGSTSPRYRYNISVKSKTSPCTPGPSSPAGEHDTEKPVELRGASSTPTQAGYPPSTVGYVSPYVEVDDEEQDAESPQTKKKKEEDGGARSGQGHLTGKDNTYLVCNRHRFRSSRCTDKYIP